MARNDDGDDDDGHRLPSEPDFPDDDRRTLPRPRERRLIDRGPSEQSEPTASSSCGGDEDVPSGTPSSAGKRCANASVHDYHSYFRRSSTDDSNFTRRSEGEESGRLVTAEMHSVSLPPPGDGDENDDTSPADAAAAEGGSEEGAEGGERAVQEEAEERQRPRRPRARGRACDRDDFRTSITTVATRASQFVQSNDEDPTFWGVSGRWFSDAGEFVGELTGMATRRADIEEAAREAAAMPRTVGVEIVSAADDDDEGDNDDDGGEFADEEAMEVNFVDFSNRTGLGLSASARTGSRSGDRTQFDDLSSLGDTPTGIVTAATKSRADREVWKALAFLAMVLVLAQAAFHGTNVYHAYSSSMNWASVFAPRRSRRYARLRAKLVPLSGEDALLNEGSPQNKALVYLADGDSLALDPYDPTALPQFKQRYALAVLYFSTNGPKWNSRTYWLTGRHECGWLFVVCSDAGKGDLNATAGEDGRVFNNTDDDYYNLVDSKLGMGEGKVVTGLSLHDQGLSGKIPKEIGALEFLRVLDLGNNNLNGIIGPEFGRLQHLRRLYLENNSLKGGIEAVPWLSSLKRVNVENNQLSGTLPYELGKLKRLEEVRMGKNRLCGTIPPTLLRSPTLTKLDLHGNNITGQLDVNEASSLEYLYLYDNKLSGPLLPSVFCGISTSLIDLRLNNNSFFGNIPDTGCSMERLELLSLAQNELTGPIHNTLGINMPRMRELHLYENRLISTIPESIFRQENLTALLLGNNELTGSITSNLMNDAQKLAHFYVNSNKLSGKLDDFATSNLPSLKKLRLEYNNFSGSIPRMNMLETMELLYLYNNSFSGTLNHLESGVNLRKLKVSNNTLGGKIPSKLGDLKRLEILSLNGNKLKGTLPKALQRLTALKELRVEYNDISGVVPQGVCDLRKSFLEALVSDCGGEQPEVSCSCCTECF